MNDEGRKQVSKMRQTIIKKSAYGQKKVTA